LTSQQERTFPAEKETIPAVRHWVVDLAEKATFRSVASDLALAVTEAATNAVLHSGSEVLTVLWLSEDDHAVVELRDEGTYDEEVASPLRRGGLGLPVMTALMDEVSILRGTQNERGTRVRLVKRKAAKPRAGRLTSA
jgi:anti-sigma regulatory factor (Ser/Thr protein kinase)